MIRSARERPHATTEVSAAEPRTQRVDPGADHDLITPAPILGDAPVAAAMLGELASGDLGAWEFDDKVMNAMGLSDDLGAVGGEAAVGWDRFKAGGARKRRVEAGHASASGSGVPSIPLDADAGPLTRGSPSEPGMLVSVELGKDFRDLLELLNRHGVRYLAVGGFAVAVHGHPRYTKDLDLWIEVSPENAKRIVAALDDFGFASLGLRAEDFVDPDVVIQLGYEPNRVDLLTKLSGVEFADAYPMRTSIRIGNIDVPVIDRASLIVNKRTLGRPRDLDDAKDLEDDPTT